MACNIAALVARQVNALRLLSIDSGQLQQFAWQLPHCGTRSVALTLTHSVAVATSTYRAGIPSTRSRAHYECNGLTDNWPSWPRVRATSGRQAGSAVRQIVLPLLIGNFWHAQQRFLYRFMMTTNERRADRQTGRQTDRRRNCCKERRAEHTERETVRVADKGSGEHSQLSQSYKFSSSPQSI